MVKNRLREQTKSGIFLSYVNLFLNMFISIFFTPFLIRNLGNAEYGVYRIVSSMIGQLSIMTFGMSALVTRNIVFYNEKKQYREKENFLAMAFFISLVFTVIVCIVGVFIARHSSEMFSKSLTKDEIVTAEKLMYFFIANIALTVLNDFFSGILTGYSLFGISNFIKTARLILRVILLIILLKMGLKSIAIVQMDLMLNICVILTNIFFAFFVIGERIRFYYFDKAMLKIIFLFSGAILLQAIINQVNQNLDGIILGVMTNSSTVAIYSVALTIFMTYSSISTVIGNVFTPRATRMVAKNATPEQLTDFVSKIGRWQFMVSGLILAGFILFGKEFLLSWLSAEYMVDYKIVLILIIPMTFVSVASAHQAILDAKLKRMGRSVILMITASINVIISVIMVRRIGYIGAAYGTAFGLIVGNILLLDIYLYKSIQLNIFKMYKDVFSKLIVVFFVSILIGIPISWISIPIRPLALVAVKSMIFAVVYCALLYFLGMNNEEKEMVSKLFKNTIRKFGGRVMK